MFISSRILFLRINLQGEFESALAFAGPYHLVQNLKKLRKSSKCSKVVLLLSESQVLQQKLYLNLDNVSISHLAQILLRELNLDEPLRLQEIFYDYIDVDSSLSGLHAYQFFWVKKEALRFYLKQFKRAGFKLIKITLASNDCNLLPFREQAAFFRQLKLLLRIFLLPLLSVILCLAGYHYLLRANSNLAMLIATRYRQDLYVQADKTTLNTFNSVYALITSLPEGVSLDETIFKQGVWHMRGTLMNMQNLSVLNQILVSDHWLDSAGSVDLNEEDQHYFWQLNKS